MIQKSFMTAVQGVKKEFGNDLRTSRQLTSEAMSGILTELKKNSSKLNRSLAAEQLADAVVQYLLYRFGFTDDEEPPLIGAAVHFHLTQSRAKKLEATAMDNLWLELPWWYERRKNSLIPAITEALPALRKMLDEN